MKTLYTIIVCCLFCGCTTKLPQSPFNTADWEFQDMDGFLSRRPRMVDDLLKNKLHKEMPYQEVINLLGKSSYNSNTYTSNSIILEYQIDEIYEWDIDPVAGSYLKIIFGKDSLITNYEVIKWKKGKILKQE